MDIVECVLKVWFIEYCTILRIVLKCYTGSVDSECTSETCILRPLWWETTCHIRPL